MEFIKRLILLSLAFILPSISSADVLIHQATTQVVLTGNLDAGAALAAQSMGSFDAANPISLAGFAASVTNYAAIDAQAAYSKDVVIYDSLGAAHTVYFYFFHTGVNTYQVRLYVNSEEVDPYGSSVGIPRQITILSGGVASGTISMYFNIQGTRVGASIPDMTVAVPWNNGSSAIQQIALTLGAITQLATASSVNSSQDGFPPTWVTPTPTATATITPTPIGTDTPVPTPIPTTPPVVRPSPLKVIRNNRITSFKMAPSGGASYILEIKNARHRFIFSSSDPRPSTHDLEKGNWRARYRIKFNDGSFSFYSAWVSFRS